MRLQSLFCYEITEFVLQCDYRVSCGMTLQTLLWDKALFCMCLVVQQTRVMNLYQERCCQKQQPLEHCVRYAGMWCQSQQQVVTQHLLIELLQQIHPRMLYCQQGQRSIPHSTCKLARKLHAVGDQPRFNPRRFKLCNHVWDNSQSTQHKNRESWACNQLWISSPPSFTPLVHSD